MDQILMSLCIKIHRREINNGRNKTKDSKFYELTKNMAL